MSSPLSYLAYVLLIEAWPKTKQKKNHLRQRSTTRVGLGCSLPYSSLTRGENLVWKRYIPQADWSIPNLGFSGSVELLGIKHDACMDGWTEEIDIINSRWMGGGRAHLTRSEGLPRSFLVNIPVRNQLPPIPRESWRGLALPIKLGYFITCGDAVSRVSLSVLANYACHCRDVEPCVQWLRRDSFFFFFIFLSSNPKTESFTVSCEINFF